MAHEYSVPLKKIIRDLHLQVLYYPETEQEILVCHSELMRPGLALSGFYQGFVPARINMIGRTELAYLEQLDPEIRRDSLETFLAKEPKAVIVTRNFSFGELFLQLAKKYRVPLMRSPENTSHMAAQLNAKLSLELAPRITEHGVLMEIYGEGVLLMGDSGVGKSETALELLKRGHRLIADDAVEIRRVSSQTLVGSAPDNIRHFMELRGVGIINVSRLFGVGAIKNTANINFIIKLESFDPSKEYDRMGIEEQTTEILGMKVPCATIPVKTGRNLAVIIEVATMNYRQKMMGYNSAVELLRQLGMDDDVPDTSPIGSDFDSF